jgi:hypothetical protein
MLLLVRLCLFVAAFGFGIASVAYTDSTVLEPTVVDPQSDPQYADIDKSAYNQLLTRFAPKTSHESAYQAASQAYEQEVSFLSQKQEEAVETRKALFAGAGLVLITLFIISLPWRHWLRTFKKTTDTVVTETTKAALVGVKALKSVQDNSPIVGRSGLSSYSIADELEKWSRRRAEGIVTEQEFEEARTKLLKR